MYEVGDRVKYRRWNTYPWEDGTWEVFERHTTYIYGDAYHLYTIKNLETGEIKTECSEINLEIL